MNVQGSTVLGNVDLLDAQNTAASATPGISQRWVDHPNDPFTMAESVKDVSANTPVNAAASVTCGRVVYSDIHVSSGDSSSEAEPFPSGCTSTGLSPREKSSSSCCSISPPASSRTTSHRRRPRS
jgi:hypothetical protein